MTNKLIHQYVDAATEQLMHWGIRKMPGQIAPEMKDASILSDDDWIGWKPILSTVIDGDLDELELLIGAEIPLPYRILLKYKHFYELNGRGIQFSKFAVDTWKQILIEEYEEWLPELITGVGLIPFGNEALMDAGPVCFDTRSRLPDGDCPVVFWDHEWVGTDKEIRPLFSSTMKMFECLLICATNDLNFIYHDEDDPPEELAQKKSLMKKFLDTDSEGAGGPALDYWTAWGVTPDGI